MLDSGMRNTTNVNPAAAAAPALAQQHQLPAQIARRPLAVDTKKAVQCPKFLRNPLKTIDRTLDTVHRLSITTGPFTTGPQRAIRRSFESTAPARGVIFPIEAQRPVATLPLEPDPADPVA